jgi:branched-chain amino acid transport system substrate-binding protein
VALPQLRRRRAHNQPRRHATQQLPRAAAACCWPPAPALLRTHPLSVLAQGGEDIVIGGSIPMTGVFAFAGVGINAGIQDYVKIVNDAGGIKGRKVKYVPEDTGYKVDVSVAAFKKITSQNKVNLYYGDSTGFSKTINPELDRNGNILMAGASFATELNDPKKYPNQFLVGPTTPRCSASCSSTSPRKSRAPRWPSSTPTPSSAATPSKRAKPPPRSWACRCPSRS